MGDLFCLNKVFIILTIITILTLGILITVYSEIKLYAESQEILQSLPNITDYIKYNCYNIGELTKAVEFDDLLQLDSDHLDINKVSIKNEGLEFATRKGGGKKKGKGGGKKKTKPNGNQVPIDWTNFPITFDTKYPDPIKAIEKQKKQQEQQKQKITTTTKPFVMTTKPKPTTPTKPVAEPLNLNLIDKTCYFANFDQILPKYCNQDSNVIQFYIRKFDQKVYSMELDNYGVNEFYKLEKDSDPLEFIAGTSGNGKGQEQEEQQDQNIDKKKSKDNLKCNDLRKGFSIFGHFEANQGRNSNLPPTIAGKFINIPISKLNIEPKIYNSFSTFSQIKLKEFGPFAKDGYHNLENYYRMKGKKIYDDLIFWSKFWLFAGIGLLIFSFFGCCFYVMFERRCWGCCYGIDPNLTKGPVT